MAVKHTSTKQQNLRYEALTKAAAVKLPPSAQLERVLMRNQEMMRRTLVIPQVKMTALDAFFEGMRSTFDLSGRRADKLVEAIIKGSTLGAIGKDFERIGRDIQVSADRCRQLIESTSVEVHPEQKTLFEPEPTSR